MLAVFLTQAALAFKPWPPRYTIKGTWKVPYTNLSNTITIVTEPGRQYTDQMNGLLKIWNTGPEEMIHRKIVVADNQTICYGNPEGQGWDIEFTQFLPDPSGFKLQKGEYTYHGRLCDLWVREVDGGKKQTWKMYIDKKGNPVAYIATAISIYHSHYDVYVLEIDEFIPDVLPGVWNLPENCKDAPPDPYPGAQFNLFFPSDKKHFQKNMDKIRSHTGSHNVGVTKFAHMNTTQFRKTLNRNLKVKKSNAIPDVCKTWKGTGMELPTTFSWRNFEGIVGKPRDQVACGSCWAFGTAELLESQFAIKTGVFREVSTNQIMDCTWDADNFGCQGGEVGPSLSSLMGQDADIATEAEYPYIGVSGFCERKITQPLGKIVDCFHVERKTKSVKEALYKYGPLAISINVVDGMSLYTSGVFDDETCTGADDDLIHIVLLTGWTVIDGKEAWEVKNSWSTYWGDEGYIYIQSKDQEKNCGVTSRAVGVVVEVAQH